MALDGDRDDETDECNEKTTYNVVASLLPTQVRKRGNDNVVKALTFDPNSVRIDKGQQRHTHMVGQTSMHISSEKA